MNKWIDYLNGELNEAERAEVEHLLATDPDSALGELKPNYRTSNGQITVPLCP
jgi:hypothetical protein